MVVRGLNLDASTKEGHETGLLQDESSVLEAVSYPAFFSPKAFFNLAFSSRSAAREVAVSL